MKALFSAGVFLLGVAAVGYVGLKFYEQAHINSKAKKDGPPDGYDEDGYYWPTYEDYIRNRDVPS